MHWKGFAILLTLLTAHAGNRTLADSGGSSYSTIGIGDLRYLPGVRSAGMGYTGIGVPGVSYINTVSPATWSRINRTRFEGDLLYEGFGSTDGTTSRYIASMDFSGATLAIPLAEPYGIVFVTGFAPYSKVNYDLYTTGSFPLSSDTLDYKLHHVGSGGISDGKAGLSYSPFTSLSIGGSIDYLFGKMEKTTSLVTQTTLSAGGSITDQTTVSGVIYSLGALYTGFGEIFEPLRPLALGVVVTSRARLSTRQETMYAFTTENDTSVETRGSIVIPPTIGIGLGYQAGERYIFAADYSTQPWSRSEINGETPIDVRDSHRAGVGIERLASKDPYAPWLDRVTLRLGFSYLATYYQVNGQPVNQWTATAGFAIPFSGETRMNVAVEYGKRGATGNGLIRDNIFRMSFSFNIGELWFVRYEEE